MNKAPFKNLIGNLVVFPDELQCTPYSYEHPDATGCGYFNMDSPEAVAIASEAGVSIERAACKCPQRMVVANREADQRRIASNLPHQGPDSQARTLGNFKKRPGTEMAVAAAEQMIAMDGPRILTLVGEKGTGKGHIVEAIGREWLHAGYTVRYDPVGDLLNELRSAFDRGEDKDSIQTMMDFRHTKKLLILDDLGKTSGTNFAKDQLFALVDHRYRNDTWLLVTTNLGREEMEAKAGEFLADRLWDKGENCSVILLDCESYRNERSADGG